MKPRHPMGDAEHVARCADCQARAALDVGALDVDLERVWIGVAAEAWAREPGPLERLASRLLRSPGLARALVATPSLVLSWVLASVAALAAGALATPFSGDPWAALLAPALAGAGIAYSYGPGVDPAYELSRTVAVSDRMVLLVRALAVFGLNAALGIVASLVTATAVGLTLGWLVPMTTVSALALAAATLARSANVGLTVALLSWGLVVVGSRARTGDYASAVTNEALLPFYAAATVGLVLLTLYATNPRRGEGEKTWR